MTFIASVIAKKGVALIADSLVTTSRPVLEFDDFYKYLQEKNKEDTGSDEIKIDHKEVIDLFKSKPSHTKDFQEKLFFFDNYTAISTAGSAFLNEKSLEEIILACIEAFNNSGLPNTVEAKNEFLEQYFNGEGLDSLRKGNIVRDTVLIITQYSRANHTTKIHKLYIYHATPEKLNEENFKCTMLLEQSNYSSVVCEGQNRISERILWGDLDTILEIIPKVANKIFKDFDISRESIPENYVTNMVSDTTVLPSGFYDDIKMNKLRELSLQQAIDLACLLMRIERDIQK